MRIQTLSPAFGSGGPKLPGFITLATRALRLQREIGISLTANTPIFNLLGRAGYHPHSAGKTADGNAFVICRNSADERRVVFGRPDGLQELPLAAIQHDPGTGRLVYNAGDKTIEIAGDKALVNDEQATVFITL